MMQGQKNIKLFQHWKTLFQMFGW